jgi:valyl-tRNA synthetase
LELDKHYSFEDVEQHWQEFWKKEGIYDWDPDASGPVFSVDTPPPYVSAAHLHVGHAMSYAQAEFVVRYRRMNGDRIFYPMGFDDNGLPTERYVEKTYDINKRKTTRKAFRALCLEETTKGAKVYEDLWRSLGLFVDWKFRYSTISDHCQRTAQMSFLDLHKKDRIYRSSEPVLWDTHFETSLAQADQETITRRGKLHHISFSSPDGQDLRISTTRPELIPACVALYCNPDDERYKSLVGGTACVPLFDHQVPIKTSHEVKMDFGSGLMMVCTFGDGEDVKKWKADNLDTRVCIEPNGRMSELAGPYAGKSIQEARANIIRDLKTAGLHHGFDVTEQHVSVAERSGTPVEFMMAPQWFIRVLDQQETWLKRSDEIRWYPEFMKSRLDNWINGLKYDWNISRQRFYGVPFPVWYCDGCGSTILAEPESLPVDPLEDPPPVDACAQCGGTDISGEPDVMDTWMTSSLTPLVNANWAQTPGRTGTLELHPMTVRVQAFEIIRTWLFYTLVKSDMHCDTLPWRDVMISGWGLNEQGKKISKRDLAKSTDKNGFNRYDPHQVIQKYGADSLRYWATGATLGHDLRYREKHVSKGKRLLTKLWNASRLAMGFVADGASESTTVVERTPVDRWAWHHYNRTLQIATESLDSYDFATAIKAIDRFFWHYFCDYYLEMIKDRFWSTDVFTDEERESTRQTMGAIYRGLLGMYAIYLPHITEELYQRFYQESEGTISIHRSAWPTVDTAALEEEALGEQLQTLVGAVRAQRSQERLRNSQRLASVVISCDETWRVTVESLRSDLRAALRTDEIRFGDAEHETSIEGLSLTLTPRPDEPRPEEPAPETDS